MTAPAFCPEDGRALVDGRCPCGYQLPDEVTPADELRVPDPDARAKAVAQVKAMADRSRKKGRLTRERPEPGALLRRMRP